MEGLTEWIHPRQKRELASKKKQTGNMGNKIGKGDNKIIFNFEMRTKCYSGFSSFPKHCLLQEILHKCQSVCVNIVYL